MSDDNKSKKIDTSKVEEIPFEMVTGQESNSVKKEGINFSDQQEGSTWSAENQSRLEDLERNIETRKSKIRELDRNIQELSSKKIDRMGAVSYSESQIKESIEDLIKNIKAIKKVNSLELKGKGDFIEATIDINAEKETFIKTIKVRGTISITFGNQEGHVVVKKHKVEGHGFVDKTLINTELKPMLPKVPELLKDYIENKEGNYTKRIFIENGELKAEFNTPETETGVAEKLEKLELERKTEESLLVELEKSATELQQEKETLLSQETTKEEDYKPFDIKKSMEVPLESKIEKEIFACVTEDDLENLTNEIRKNKDNIKDELKTTWPDVEAVLKSPKKELLDIIGLWKDWTKNEENPELQEWSKRCLATLGETMGIESELETKEEPKEEEKEPVITTNNEAHEEPKKEDPSPSVETESTPEKSEEEPTTQEEGVEYIPIVEENEKFRKVILEAGYLRNEIKEELRSLMESKSIVPEGEELVEVDSTKDSLVFKINIKHSNGEKKWNLEAILEKEEETNEVKFTKFEYKKDDSHYYRLDFKNKLNEILERLYEKISNKHGEGTNSKNTKILVQNGRLEIIFEKNDKN